MLMNFKQFDNLSDSEEEGETSGILQPLWEAKSAYRERRLPHIIGSVSFLVS